MGIAVSTTEGKGELCSERKSNVYEALSTAYTRVKLSWSFFTELGVHSALIREG
jgi:hypothetical protein